MHISQRNSAIGITEWEKQIAEKYIHDPIFLNTMPRICTTVCLHEYVLYIYIWLCEHYASVDLQYKNIERNIPGC